MSGIKEQRSGFQAGQESSEAKEGFAKAIMLGSRIEERKDRQTGIGIGEQIQIITEIPPFTGRIPTDITVGLRERAEAVAIKDALLPAITGMMGAKAGCCHNRGAITSDVKLVGMNRSPTNGFIQETGTEDLKQGAVSFIVHMKDSRGQAGNEMSNSFLFYGGSLLALDFGFLHPLDYRGFQVV